MLNATFPSFHSHSNFICFSFNFLVTQSYNTVPVPVQCKAMQVPHVSPDHGAIQILALHSRFRYSLIFTTIRATPTQRPLTPSQVYNRFADPTSSYGINR